MSVAAARQMPQRLHVMGVAAEPRRLAVSTRLFRDLGHVVVSAREDASVVLADGIAPPGWGRAVVLGARHEAAEGRLPRNAAPEQSDAALRGVAAGLRVSPADDTGGSFESID